MFTTEPQVDPTDETWRVAPEAERLIVERLPGLNESTLASFKNANTGPRDVTAEVLSVKGVRVAEKPCGEAMEENPDMQFVELSDVGIGLNGRQALVYLGVLDGDLGRGWLVLLDRTEEGWTEKGRLGVWVA